MDAPHLEPRILAVGLGVEAPDELAVVEDRQRVVAMGALMPRSVDLDPVVEAEQAPGALAVPQERVERREQGRPARRLTPPPRRGRERPQVLGEREPAPGTLRDRDLHHLAAR